MMTICSLVLFAYNISYSYPKKKKKKKRPLRMEGRGLIIVEFCVCGFSKWKEGVELLFPRPDGNFEDGITEGSVHFRPNPEKS
jgi:hypothetical protein